MDWLVFGPDHFPRIEPPLPYYRLDRLVVGLEHPPVIGHLQLSCGDATIHEDVLECYVRLGTGLRLPLRSAAGRDALPFALPAIFLDAGGAINLGPCGSPAQIRPLHALADDGADGGGPAGDPALPYLTVEIAYLLVVELDGDGFEDHAYGTEREDKWSPIPIVGWM